MVLLAQLQGPTKDFNNDWGCPKMDDPGSGTLGSAKYAGCVTLYADDSSHTHTDDPYQPRTTWFISGDLDCFTNANQSQYEETFMNSRWDVMTEGHPLKQHDEVVGDTYAKNYSDPRRQIGGGVAMGQGFGPYNGFAPGDSIHIVFAEGVSGISWEKGREVGSNWLQWYNSASGPELILPDGNKTDDFNLYKRRWCETGKDSILQTYRNAFNNFKSNYTLPQAPPPPNQFTVTSGGDKIMLDWAKNAESDQHFGGYVIYRAAGKVLDWTSNYEKIFECDKLNAVNHFDDVTAKRGYDYFYYIQSKDDGTQVLNEILYSSLFWTVTSQPATLQRQAEPITPYPPSDVNITKFWKLIATFKGTWFADTNYSSSTHDIVIYKGLNYICKLSISDTTTPNIDITHWQLVTTQGDSIAFDRGAWISRIGYADSTHDIVSYSGSSYICRVTIPNGTAPPNLDNTHWKLLTSQGNWISGSHYSANDIVSYYGSSFVTLYTIASGKGLDLVRVVPNPYDIRGRFLQFGDQSQYDRIAFYGLPPICNLKIFTERGDLIWEKNHVSGTGDELWNSQTSYGQIVASGIYILYVETTDRGSICRKFVIIR